MTLSLDSFLSSLAQGYNVPEAKVDQAAVVQATIQAVKAKVETAQPVKAKPALTFPVQAKGTLTALDFIRAMHDAGMRRTEAGKPYFNPQEQRNDQIKAIAAFIGYDPADHFGSQELRARMQAWREINPEPVIDRSVTLVAKPVPGMPDFIGKNRANLEARERLAVEAIVEHENASREYHEGSKDCEHCGESCKGREYHETFAMLERERLSQIQADLDLLKRAPMTYKPFEAFEEEKAS